MPHQPTTKVGRIKIHFKKFGFIDGENMFINPHNVLDAFDKDLVEYTVIQEFNEQHQKGEAKVVKVIERFKTEYVVEVVKSGDQVVATFDDPKITYPIQISGYNKGFIGEKILIKIVDFRRFKLRGTFLKSLGHKNDKDVDILSIIHDLDVDQEFNQDVNREMDSLSDKLPELKSYGIHRDLTDHSFFTIDPTDSKDFDDAVCVKKNSDNSYELLVAIADVWSYLNSCPATEKTALSRNSSIYLFNSVIPMLPFKLSSDLCSLVENKERGVLAVKLNISDQGHIGFDDVEIFPAIIKSKKRFTYDQVNQYLNKEIENFKDTSPEIQKTIDDSYVLYTLLEGIRKQKGFIEINKPTNKFELDENNDIKSIFQYRSGHAQKLIEIFMVSANTAVAVFCKKHKIPSIYRNHEKPNPEKVKFFVDDCKDININIPMGEIEDVDVKKINHWVEKYKTHKNFIFMQDLMLNTLLKKAQYSEKQTYHFGLNLYDYLHFTSPIRRSPDLIVHKLLYMYVFDSKKYTQAEKSTFIASLQQISNSATESEIRNAGVENKVIKEKLFKFLTKEHKTSFESTVVYKNKAGLVIRVNDIYETFVRYTNPISLGTKVLVKLIEGTRDFRVVKVL